MSTSGKLEFIRVDAIDLDTSNPRIANFLEHQEPPYTAEMIHIALEAGGDDESSSGTSFNKLKQSIQTHGGIVQPIILLKEAGGRYRCIEGNTRVFIYREFKQKGIAGNWDTIPGLVHSEIDENLVHAIRLQAHLVGPRAWHPYSKAKYLYFLRNSEHLPFSQLVDLCGGNQKSIIESLGAYEDMEKVYRPLVGDEGFDLRKFSGFVELQKPGIKPAMLAAGFSETDFAEWINDEKIEKLAYVRNLPAVLRNDQARAVFLAEGMEKAIKLLDRPQITKPLEDAEISSLARALRQKVDGLEFTEFRRLQDNPSHPTVQHLQEVRDSIVDLLKQIEGE